MAYKPEATYSKLAKILDYAYELGEVKKRPIAISEATDEFLRFEAEFDRKKELDDNVAQLKEIEIYKLGESQKLGYDIGFEKARKEWCEKYADVFRTHREGPKRNGFEFVERPIINVLGLHVRPSNEISQIVISNDCNIFLNRESVKTILSPNFINGLEEEERNFIYSLMPKSSDVINLSALTALAESRNKQTCADYAERDKSNRMLCSIKARYVRLVGDSTLDNDLSMSDYDLVIVDEFNNRRPYLDLTSRALTNGGGIEKISTTLDLMNLGAIPGDILRFVIRGKDAGRATADINYALDKRHSRSNDSAQSNVCRI